MSSPRVSVVLPTFDRAAVVVVAIDSALAQTMPDVEVVVVDDGSTDGTSEALAARYGSDPRVRVIRRPNGGVSAARNTGIDAARGEYVAFLDSDDAYFPDHVARTVEFLDAHPDVDLTVSDALMEDPRYAAGQTFFRHPNFRPPISPAHMLRGGWAMPSVLVVRTAAARAIRFDEGFRRQEDTEFLHRFHAAGRRAALVPTVTVRYCRNDAPKTRRLTEDSVEMERHGLALFERHGASGEEHPERAIEIRRRRRKFARALVRAGRYREARPYCLGIWRERWWRPRPLLWWVRGFFPDRAP